MNELLDHLRTLDSSSRTLNELHKWFHSNISYVSDKELYGVEDYWATPFETFENMAGDCEDWAIAEYFILLWLGFSIHSLRLVYCDRYGSGHIVLCHGPKMHVLDSMQQLIVPLAHRPDLTEVYRFNGSGIWLGSMYLGKTEERISNWKEMIKRYDSTSK